MAAHLPRLLEALGATPSAAVTAAALVGPAQVGARLIEFSFLRRVSPLVSARLATALHPVAAALLAVIGAPAAVLFTLLHGGGNGLLTIVRGTLPLALFGAPGYGLRTGLLAAPARILQDGAPLLFSLVLDKGGPGLCAIVVRNAYCGGLCSPVVRARTYSGNAPFVGIQAKAAIAWNAVKKGSISCLSEDLVAPERVG